MHVCNNDITMATAPMFENRTLRTNVCTYVYSTQVRM